MLEARTDATQILTIRGSNGLEMTYEMSAGTKTSQDHGEFNPTLNNSFDPSIIKPLAEAFGALENLAEKK